MPFDDDNGNQAGSAYVFERTGSTWIESAKLIATDVDAVDQFGHSVAISGETIAIGAVEDEPTGSASGSAFLYQKDGSFWTEVHKLVASDAGSGDQFGFAIAIDGQRIAVGAVGADAVSPTRGAAYVFEPTLFCSCE